MKSIDNHLKTISQMISHPSNDQNLLNYFSRIASKFPRGQWITPLKWCFANLHNLCVDITSRITLTHWDQDELTALLQATFSNAFSWKKMHEFQLKFHCRRCSNCIFILDLTSGFNGFGKDNCKTRRESLKFWDLVWLILEILRYLHCLNVEKS